MRSEHIITKIDSLLNCDYEAKFEIKPLTDLPIGDHSLHYKLSKNKSYVDFGILEIAAYMWECPTEGRVFIKELDKYAKKNNLKLVIPTVLNPKLETILGEAGYTLKEVPYMGDICELWSK